MIDRRMQFGTYRCPVCGHRDGTELEVEEPRRVVTCVYCGTELEVQARGPESVRFIAQVSEARVPG